MWRETGNPFWHLPAPKGVKYGTASSKDVCLSEGRWRLSRPSGTEYGRRIMLHEVDGTRHDLDENRWGVLRSIDGVRQMPLDTVGRKLVALFRDRGDITPSVSLMLYHTVAALDDDGDATLQAVRSICDRDEPPASMKAAHAPAVAA